MKLLLRAYSIPSAFSYNCNSPYKPFFLIYLLRLYRTSAEGLDIGHQVLQPAKHVEFRTVCLKSCRQEDSLEPTVIRLTLLRVLKLNFPLITLKCLISKENQKQTKVCTIFIELCLVYLHTLM